MFQVQTRAEFRPKRESIVSISFDLILMSSYMPHAPLVYSCPMRWTMYWVKRRVLELATAMKSRRLSRALGFLVRICLVFASMLRRTDRKQRCSQQVRTPNDWRQHSIYYTGRGASTGTAARPCLEVIHTNEFPWTLAHYL